MNPSFIAVLLVAAITCPGSIASAEIAAPLQSADAAFAAGDLMAAARLYERAVAADANDPRANLGLGRLELYRNELVSARTHLTRALAGDAASAPARALVSELHRREHDWTQPAIVAGGRAAIPFVVSDPLPIVRVSINGTPERTFVIDTGGPSILLDPQFAAELGLRVQTAGTGVFSGGKTAPVGRAEVTSVRLGDARAENVSADVLPVHSMLAIPGLTVDGIVGTGLFERFLATIDYPNAQLVLQPRDRARSTAFQRAARRAGATIVPCWLAGDHFVLAQAQVNDAPPGLFFFDSGCAGCGLMAGRALVDAAHLRLNQAAAGIGTGGGGPVAAIPFTATRIAVGSAVERDVPGLYTPEGTPLTIFPFAVEGFISHDFLRHYAYTVDFDAMTIVLATPTR